jgi:Zn-dependent protease with chaperone function
MVGLLHGVVPAWLMIIVIVSVMLMLQAVIESELSLLMARRRAASVPSAVAKAKADVEAATGITVDGPIVVDRQDALSAQVTWRLFGRPVLVLSTAMARLDPAALTAVIAHEYAHVSMGHLSTRLWLSVVTSIVAVFAIAFLVPMVGLDDAPRPVAMFVFVSVVLVGQRLVLNALIRRQEREADTFAASVAGADAMRAALTATPRSGLPPAFSMWTTHDSLETRQNTVEQRKK